MKGKIANILNSETVLLASRLILGSIFIVASISKLSHPDEFVTLVASYNMLPYGLASVYGYLIPWLELFIGLFLILGLFTRFASVVSIPIIISFIIASSYKLLTSGGGSCGCFGGVMPLTLPQSLNLDALMLLLAIPSLVRRTSLTHIGHWLGGSNNHHLKTRGYTFSRTSRVLAIIAVIALLLPSFPQTVDATIISDQDISMSQPTLENLIVLNEEIQGPAEVKSVVINPSTDNAKYVPLDARIDIALTTKEAAFLYFYADWCDFCHKQKPIIDTLEHQYSGQISFIRLNNEKEAEAFKQFGVTGFPTMFLISERGETGDYISQKLVGFTDEMKLKASFDRIISDRSGPPWDIIATTTAPSTSDQPSQGESLKKPTPDIAMAPASPGKMLKPPQATGPYHLNAGSEQEMRPREFATSDTSNPVALDMAKKVAINHLKRVSTTEVQIDGLSVSEVLTEIKEGKNLYYIVNIDPEGWVIVSADYVAYPIVAYSETGYFSADEQPTALKRWAESVKKEIFDAIVDNLTPSAETSEAWDILEGGLSLAPDTLQQASGPVQQATGAIAPLIRTTWGQGGKSSFAWAWFPSYDRRTPAECAKAPWCYWRIAPTGCTATAVAQVMKYWGWPLLGTGSHSWNPPWDCEGQPKPWWATSRTCYGYGNQTVDFGAQDGDGDGNRYDWTDDKMPLNKGNLEISELMWDIGMAVNMNWDPLEGSGANLIPISGHPGDAFTASKTYFKYNPQSIWYRHRVQDSDDPGVWEQRLIDELAAGRPILYEGNTPGTTETHTFIVDGYDGGDMFHINWGWNGNHNAYYKLDDLTPGNQNWTDNQRAIFGLKPLYEAGNDSYSVNENEALVVAAPGLLANDTGSPLRPLHPVKKSNPRHGTLNYFNTDGSFKYTPEANFYGTDSFTYYASDDLAESNTATVTITVNKVANDPPVADAGGPYVSNEGSPITFNGLNSHDNDGSITGYEWDFDSNGVYDAVGSQPAFTWPDDHTGTVTLRVTDNDGDKATVTTSVEVLNISPSVDAGPDAILDEGDTFTSSGSFTDPGEDTWTATVDYGDGVGMQSLSLSGKNFNLSHVYSDNGIYTVTVTVQDEDGGVGSNNVKVTVSNIDPVIESLAATSVSESGTVHLTGTYSDVGTEDTHELTIDWGEGVPETVAVNGGAFDITHQYLDDNPTGTASDVYTIDVNLADDDLGTDTASTTTTISNIDPVITATGATIDEGDTATVTATYSDAGTKDTHMVTIDWDDGTIDGPLPVTGGSLSVSHFYGDNHIYNVSIIITDDDTGTDTDTVTVIVNNANPSLTLDTLGAIAFSGGDAFLGMVGIEQMHIGSATDPGSDDLTFNWDFGGGFTSTVTYYNDGISPDPYPSPSGTCPFSVSDTTTVSYSAPGVYMLNVKAVDDDAGSDTEGLNKLVTDCRECAKTIGFWRHQFCGKGRQQIDDATLESYLAIVDFASVVFENTTIEEACIILKSSGDDDDDDDDRSNKRGKGKAQALAAWLNFAKGAADWNETITIRGDDDDDDGDRLVTMVFYEAMAEVESILLDPNATHSNLAWANTISNSINEIDEDNETCDDDDDDEEDEEDEDDKKKKKNKKKNDNDDEDDDDD